ncbi:MAG TPA: hypothetical protein VKC90_12305 [Chitinophagaceae bacterium]|nr:hypothetical protein [Chitinophagaceae bacterium]
MEVHAHSHTTPKKWTHYLWEFLMLFLAVFCGFLAENFREHKVEQQRAGELAKNLYKELYTDSITVQQCLGNRSLKENECSYFINYVKDSDLINLSTRFFPAFTTALIQIQYIIFEPNDGILNQLRNSGELRYFKNSELQSGIGNLGVKIAYVRTRNDKEYSYIEFYNRPFILKYFDFKWYEAFTQQGSIPLVEALKQNTPVKEPAKIVNPDKFSRQEAENIVSYYLLMLRSTRQIQYKEYADANHKVLALLRKEYHLE